MKHWAMACAEGAKKYGDYNWEKGMPVSDMLNHGIRHLYMWLNGDRSEDHLGHAMWNVAGAIHSYHTWPELNQNLRKEYGVAESPSYDGKPQGDQAPSGVAGRCNEFRGVAQPAYNPSPD
jgi:hypothetical protein